MLSLELMLPPFVLSLLSLALFVDTANNYQNEESEKWIGEWMEKRGNRDRIVLATKFTVRSRLSSLSSSARADHDHVGDTDPLPILRRGSRCCYQPLWKREEIASSLGSSHLLSSLASPALSLTERALFSHFRSSETPSKSSKPTTSTSFTFTGKSTSILSTGSSRFADLLLSLSLSSQVGLDYLHPRGDGLSGCCRQVWKGSLPRNLGYSW